MQRDTVELGNLSPSRDFVYVTDVVDALLSVLADGDPGSIYNVGRGESVSVGEVAEIVIDEVDRDVELVSTAERQRSDDVEISDHVADISRVSSLGWQPRYDIRDGIRATIREES
jgi:UDP-glucose 4-epimerase